MANPLHFLSAASINAGQLAEGPATIEFFSLINTTTDYIYLKFCELAAGDSTPDPSTDSVVWTEPIPPSDGVYNGANVRNLRLSLTNPGYWLTTDLADTGSTAVTAGAVLVSIAGRWE